MLVSSGPGVAFFLDREAIFGTDVERCRWDKVNERENASAGLASRRMKCDGTDGGETKNKHDRQVLYATSTRSRRLSSLFTDTDHLDIIF